MRRMIRPLVALAVCAVGLPLGALGAPPSGGDLIACNDQGRQVVDLKNHWLRIPAPKMDASQKEGPRTIVDWATPPNLKKRMYMTNGVVVKASVDYGCHWDATLRKAPSQLGAEGAPRRDMISHLAAGGNGSLYMATYDIADSEQANQAVYRPHVYVAQNLTDDKTLGAATFTEIAGGLPQAGKPVQLASSPFIESIAYVVIEGPDPDLDNPDVPARHVYRKTAITVPQQVPAQAPSLWKEVTLPDGFGHVDGITPTMGNNGLYVWQGNKYAYSPDLSADEPAWTATTAEGRVTAIDAGPGAALVAVQTSQGAIGHYLGDDGKAYHRDIALPLAPTTVTHGSRSLVFAAAGPKGVAGWDRGDERWVTLTPKGAPAFTKLQMPTGPYDKILLAQGGDDWYRFDTYAGEYFLEPPPFVDGWGDYRNKFPKGDINAPHISPEKAVVTIEPGKLQDVPVDFSVPGDANRLEVYFLMDSTGSMENAVSGLRKSIEDISVGLKKALPTVKDKNGKPLWEACLGLGDFKDWSSADTKNNREQNVYTRDVPIDCTDQAVGKIRNSLQFMTVGGGGDAPEAQTVALQQAVTGQGQGVGSGSTNRPTSPVLVPPGREAGFSPGAFKIVVMITDQYFKQDPADYPSIRESIDSLNNTGVNVVGVLVDTAQDAGDKAKARRDLEQVASETKTTAPNAGLDCDGDGRKDLRGRAPLVCDLEASGTNIGPAILSLLLGVYDPGLLAVQVRDQHHVVERPIVGQTSKIVNMKRQNTLGFVMPVMCTQKQDGQDLPVELLGTVRAVPSAYGEVVVRCRSNPIAPPPIIKPPPEPVLDLIRPVKPPVAIVLPNPPPAPAQPISNINLNAGFSKQEEQQYQLATVAQGASDQQVDDAEEIELAMSDYRARDAAAGGIALGGATLVSAAGAVAMRRRLRVQRARAYNRF